jgi:mannose-6-phosphate isomerase-like protein (cupin superfamily)
MSKIGVRRTASLTCGNLPVVSVTATEDNIMKRTIVVAAYAALLIAPSTRPAQAPTAATYISDEDVKTVNSQPGTDRTIRVVDIGGENFAVGVIHRGASAARATGARGAGGGTAGAARGGSAATGTAVTGFGSAVASATTQSCGRSVASVPQGSTAGGISHDSQTEGYYIISGGGTLVTGGFIVNGTKSSATSAVTRELNGPSSSGAITGDDVVKKVVKAGDIIIIPAGVPHGWTDIGDHVDYLSFRPSARVLEAGYVHPSIRK